MSKIGARVATGGEVLRRRSPSSSRDEIDLGFPTWKPVPGNDGPLRVRIQESNASLDDDCYFVSYRQARQVM